MGKTDNIKSRKQLQSEYASEYSKVSDNIWERLTDELGDKLNEELLISALERVKEIRNKMTYSELQFTFKEIPTQAHRVRVNFYTKAMRTPNAKDNSKAIEKLILGIRKDLTLICTPMKVILTAYYPMPHNIKPLDLILFETKHQFCVEKPDFDNVLKAYCDMIQTHIILDDDLVCSCQFDKYYSLKPRVELRVIYQDHFDAECTYKKIKARKRFKEQQDRITAKLLVPMPRKRGKKLC